MILLANDGLLFHKAVQIDTDEGMLKGRSNVSGSRFSPPTRSVSTCEDLLHQTRHPRYMQEIHVLSYHRVQKKIQGGCYPSHLSVYTEA